MRLPSLGPQPSVSANSAIPENRSAKPSHAINRNLTGIRPNLERP